ncbi:retrovirus-related pol polyprotein from transposon TNT 1-94 [Tanacetum coccineum]
MESQSDSTQTVSSLKLPMLKTGDYDLWSMRMEQYLTHTDYALWEVIVNGDAPAVASASTEGPIPPKTAEQKIARKNELKAKSTLLLAIPDEHLLKFHGIKDAKSLWEAIKTRFGGNKESKKMQKTILKQQYENFTASRSEGLDKIYDSVNGKKYILVIVDDYSRFTWVKCLRSKDEAPDFIIKFLKMIQKISISHETSIARSPQQNGVVERRNQAVSTACYTQNRSIIRLLHGKTPYELLHNKLPDLSFFHVFGALCYPTNDSENLDFDELIVTASEHSSSGPALHEMTPITISLGLVSNPPPSTLFVPPSRNDWDLLFQPIFDELLTPPPSVDYLAPEVIAPIADVVAPKLAASTGSPSSTTVDQDAPLPSNSQTTPETQYSIISNDVEEDNHDLDVTHMNNYPFFGIPIPEVPSDQCSSTDLIHTIVH